MEMQGARHSARPYSGCAVRIRRNGRGRGEARGRGRREKLNATLENNNRHSYDSRCGLGWRAKVRMSVSKAASKGFSSTDNVKLSDKVSSLLFCVARIGNDDYLLLHVMLQTL